MQQKINNWLDACGDYLDGCDLLEAAGAPAALVRYYRYSVPRFKYAALKSELERMASGSDERRRLAAPRKKNETAQTEITKPVDHPAIAACRTRLTDLRTRLTELQDALCDSGTENTPTILGVRIALVKEKLSKAVLYNELFKEKERLFGLAHLRALTDSDYDGLRALLAKGAADEEAAPAETTPSVLAKLDSLTDAAAMARKLDSLRASNRRDRRMLDYGSFVIGQRAVNPMPDCPRRRAIELRMKERTMQILTLENRLATLRQQTPKG